MVILFVTTINFLENEAGNAPVSHFGKCNKLDVDFQQFFYTGFSHTNYGPDFRGLPIL